MDAAIGLATMKTKRSFRLTDEAIRKIEATAKALGINATSALEILIRQAPEPQRQLKEKS